MNQKQRDFLTSHIEKQARRELEAINKEEPKPPSLNNYLVAAALRRELCIRSVREIQDAIEQKVLSLGPNDALIQEGDRWGDGEKKYLLLQVSDILILPQEYTEAKQAYDAAFAAWQERKERVSELQETLLLKISLGSDRALETLIAQADNLASLSLVQQRLVALPQPEDKNGN